MLTPRRDFLGLAAGAVGTALPLAAEAEGIFTTKFPLHHSDAALLALCAEHIANRAAFNASKDDAAPVWLAYMRTRSAIDASRPMTLAGLQGKARAAKAEATMPDGRMLYEGAAMRWMISIGEALVAEAVA